MRRALRAIFTAILFPVMYSCLQTLVSQITALIYAGWWVGRNPAGDVDRLEAAWNTFFQTAAVFIAAGAAGLTLLLLFLLTRRAPGGLLGSVGITRPELPVMGLLAVCGVSALVSIVALLDVLPLPKALVSQHEEIVNQLNGGGVVANLLIVCLLLPVVEELIFRGVGQRALMDVFSPRVAALLGAVIFAVFHFNPMQIFYTLLLGMILGAVYAWFRTIIAPLTVHIAFNLGNYALGFLVQEKLFQEAIYFFLCIGAAVLLGGLFLLQKIARSKPRP